VICNFCFDNGQIKNFIEEKGKKAPEDYCCEECGECNKNLIEDMYLIEKSIMVEKLESVILNLYTHIYQYALSGNTIEPYLTLEEVCWEAFDLWDGGDGLAELISENSIMSSADGGDGFFYDATSQQWLPVCWLTPDSFDWERFSKKVKHSLRFFDTPDFNRKEELQKLDTFFEKLCSNDIGKIVYRARGIYEKDKIDIEADPQKALGKAPPKLAGHNRFSPSGISYVYLASDEKTSIYEIFEESKEFYAVGKFELYSNLRLIDLRKSVFLSILKIYIDPFSEKFALSIYCATQAVEKFIEDIQKPIKSDDKHLDYLPTQVLAEYIRSLGYDGFVFDSSKNIDGYNIVLFEEQMKYQSHQYKKATMISFELAISNGEQE